MKKITFLVFLLGLIVPVFAQNTISASGDWCNGDLALTANLTSETSIVSWAKNGVIIEDETGVTIDCDRYGKGLYTLTVNNAGTTETLSKDFSTLEGIEASFTGTNYLAAAVTFFEGASNATDEVITWSWDFGNGETSLEQNPKVMFSEQKVYTITLTITTASGCTHTFTKLHEWVYK